MLDTRVRPTAFIPVFVMKAKSIFYCCTPLRDGRHHRLYAAMMSSALQQAVRRSNILSVIHTLFLRCDLLLPSQTKTTICNKTGTWFLSTSVSPVPLWDAPLNTKPRAQTVCKTNMAAVQSFEVRSG